MVHTISISYHKVAVHLQDPPCRSICMQHSSSREKCMSRCLHDMQLAAQDSAAPSGCAPSQDHVLRPCAASALVRTAKSAGKVVSIRWHGMAASQKCFQLLYHSTAFLFIEPSHVECKRCSALGVTAKAAHHTQPEWQSVIYVLGEAARQACQANVPGRFR